MSKKLKQIHLKTLKMMIAQVVKECRIECLSLCLQMLNPVLFLYIPALINLLGMFVNSELGDLPKASKIHVFHANR